MSQFEYLSCIVGGGLFFRFSDGAFYFAILCLRIYKLIRGTNIRVIHFFGYEFLAITKVRQNVREERDFIL